MPMAVELIEVLTCPIQETCLFWFAVIIGQGYAALQIRQDQIALGNGLAHIIHRAGHQLPSLIGFRDTRFRGCPIQIRYCHQQSRN